MERIAYDEFGLFHENAAEYGLPFTTPPVVRRVEVRVADGRAVSALVWGDAPAEVVFIHGGSQNAHTWDTVALALGRPAVAVDLPGHGHSGWRDDGAYTPATPGVNQAKTKAVTDFVNGPQSFASFEMLLERTMQHNPTRTESSLRRGILHNAHQLDDGSWEWRYDRRGHARTDAPAAATDTPESPLSPLWDHFAAITCPVTLVRGGVSPVVDDDDVAEARRRQPTLRVEVVDGAGHSVQGDRPLELAALVASLLSA